MGHSSLLGTESAAPEPARRADTGVLGPGDSSDSGSDLMGVADDQDLDADDGDDFNLPTDVAMDDAHARPVLSQEVAEGVRREAADIGVDRIFTPGEPSADSGDDTDVDVDGDVDGDVDAIADGEDPDLKFVDAAEAGDPLEDENPTEPDDDDVDAEDDDDDDDDDDKAVSAR